MKRRFTITISDVHGVKQYTLHQIIKKIALYLLGGLLAIILIGGITIFYLLKEVDRLEYKKKELLLENEVLKKSIEDKTKKLDEIGDKLEDIEKLIGLKPLPESSIVERIDTAALTSRELALIFANIPNGSPVEYRGISGSFGWRKHPIKKTKEFHRGIDLRAPMNTPVYAPADAVVEYAAKHKKSGFGKLVILDHNYGFRTFYGHLNKFAVKPGDFVKKGDIIGYTGNTGLSNGPHLHYEIRFIERVLNPYYFIKWNRSDFEYIFKKVRRVPWDSLVKTVTRSSLPKKQLSSKELTSEGR
ncbi:M23 family metallopeptidase [Nitrosophilus alvini]|uniref:M23 family metallopeptidase n=1 Tax=Nitrosophilus alvini TaxID=2714855 RepID=UPI001909B90F|nr:M23 family metallopeptidase [Nitrosophilus alvini]